ncbi:hypothetical protein [Embleya sp. NPDC059259]|uniref:hypothetical protein n=1 Tax=unclassified Embleya TaxID=2699296 RepID=UPI003695B0EB
MFRTGKSASPARNRSTAPAEGRRHVRLVLLAWLILIAGAITLTTAAPSPSANDTHDDATLEWPRCC